LKVLEFDFDKWARTMVTDVDGGSSFAAVLFYGHELPLLIFEVLLFALCDLAAHNYFLGAAVTFFVMEVSCSVQFSTIVYVRPILIAK